MAGRVAGQDRVDTNCSIRECKTGQAFGCGRDANRPKDAEPQLLCSVCFVDRTPHMECGVGLGESTLGP